MIYVGTCSWTDRSLTKECGFYPAASMTAEERLRFYANRFNTVEADSPFYALPSEAVVGLHVQRTPPDFILNYKAYSMLTGHDAETRSMPKVMREMLPPELAAKARLRAVDVPAEVLALAFKMFAGALRPAQDSGKLGAVLFQFPPWFMRETKNMDYIEKCAAGMTGFSMAVEFRHPSWLIGGNEASTMEFLADRGLSYVSVDEPQFDRPMTVPPVYRATTSMGYVRLHGRNKDAWFKKGVFAAERFAYMYSQAELFDIAASIKPLAIDTDKTFVMFNNCFRDYAVNNAMIMSEILHS